MADYHIYIHANSNGTSSPTSVWQNSNQTSEWIPNNTDPAGDFSLEQFNRGVAIASNPDSLVAMGVHKAKSIPIVATAFALLYLGSKVTHQFLTIATAESGDYSVQNFLNNTNQVVRNIFNPFSASINAFNTNMHWEIENKRKTLERTLLGDATLNSYSNKGV